MARYALNGRWVVLTTSKPTVPIAGAGAALTAICQDRQDPARSERGSVFNMEGMNEPRLVEAARAGQKTHFTYGKALYWRHLVKCENRYWCLIFRSTNGRRATA